MSIDHNLITVSRSEVEPRYRFLFIDGLRGLAAIAVMGFHFYQGSPLRKPLSEVIPRPMGVLLEHGWLGVEVFFVISGFVIAYSLRNAQISFDLLQNFTLRRMIRLSPPYWATIAVAILISFISNFILSDRTASLPSTPRVLAHILYLQNILKMDDIVPVFWTLCLEIQFYLVFILLLGVKQFLTQLNFKFMNLLSSLIFGIMALGSLVLGLQFKGAAQSFFYPYWYVFFLGIMVCWVLGQKIQPVWFWFYIYIVTASLFLHWDIRAFVSLVTGLSIYMVAKWGQLHSWLSRGWQQYLGKISYSLYLLHIPIGMSLINLGYRVSGNHPGFSLVWFLLAFVISIVAAHLSYKLVEKPSINFSKTIKSFRT